MYLPSGRRGPLTEWAGNEEGTEDRAETGGERGEAAWQGGSRRRRWKGGRGVSVKCGLTCGLQKRWKDERKEGVWASGGEKGRDGPDEKLKRPANEARENGACWQRKGKGARHDWEGNSKESDRWRWDSPQRRAYVPIFDRRLSAGALSHTTPIKEIAWAEPRHRII